jgi:hypothetical protein
MPFTEYDVGPSFEGIEFEARITTCHERPNVTYIYGTCHATSDTGCSPPLEIQRRGLRSLAGNGPAGEGGGAEGPAGGPDAASYEEAPSMRRAVATPRSNAACWSQSGSASTWIPKPSPSENRIDASASGSA